MLESFVINVCVPATGHFSEVAINKHPIIVLGRESDLHRALKSNEVRDYIMHHIPEYDMYLNAQFYIRHLRRDNTDQCGQIAVTDMLKISETEWNANTHS